MFLDLWAMCTISMGKIKNFCHIICSHITPQNATKCMFPESKWHLPRIFITSCCREISWWSGPVLLIFAFPAIHAFTKLVITFDGLNQFFRIIACFKGHNMSVYPMVVQGQIILEKNIVLMRTKFFQNFILISQSEQKLWQKGEKFISQV